MVRGTTRALALVTMIVLSAGRARGAAVFHVDSTADKPDAVINGTCATVDGVCTLRAAVQEANAQPGADTVELAPGKYALKLVGALEDAAVTGDLDLTENVTIRGDGPKTVTISGKKDRVFHVLAGADVTIQGLTIKGGSTLTKDPFVNPDLTEGGGILNAGTLTLTNVVVSGNKAQDDGGGISNRGTLVMADVFITKNKALDDAGGLYNPRTTAGVVSASRVTLAKNVAGGQGGGVENQSTMTLTNTTVSGNRSASAGGGIHNATDGEIALQNVTVKDNRTKGKTAAGGISNDEVAMLTNTILDKNKPFNCGGAALSTGGGNVENALSCGLAAGDLPNVGKLQLASLKLAAGAVAPTHALKATSPAIDVGNDSGCPQADQNAQSRIDIPGVGTALCDSGATEFHPPQ